MFRTIHRWPGLLAMALLILLGLSGAVLAVFPAAESINAPRAEAGLSVAELTGRVQSQIPGVEQIKRAPSGKITAYWFEDNAFGSAVIDPATGAAVASADPNPVERWFVNLHRSLFLGDTGRIAMAVAAAVMLVLSLSGIMLVANRVGGLRHWFRPLRGPLAGRLHTEITRVAVAGFLLSSATALWMTASTFDMLPDGEPMAPYPTEVSGEMGADPATMPLLQRTAASELREFTFPYAGDATDTYTLVTDAGTGTVDQGTGEMLTWADMSGWERVSETIYMLHTGQGAWVVGVVLGLMALGIPALAFTGVVVWISRRRARPRLPGNKPAAQADTIVLVGSESGSTWGFARTLMEALHGNGHSVHATAMANFDPSRYPKAERLIIFAATYGDGDAPASAKGFLERLDTLTDALPLPTAVLGFGERVFPQFCAYARTVENRLKEAGVPILVPMDTVDGQSPQDFARWGLTLGKALDEELSLVHVPDRPETHALTLVSRRDYGAEVQAPTAILRFKAPRPTLMGRLNGTGFTRFKAGDLLGILPEGSDLPRYYSLASGAKDGFIEIVVKKQPGGLASGQLMALEPGDLVESFLRRNPAFYPARGKSPLILIGAGTGIGPLAGFIRANKAKRPVTLVFGMRDPGSDFLYQADLEQWETDGNLDHLVTAVSRCAKPRYVQDALRDEAEWLVSTLQNGARIMVCGGREMAHGVTDALADILIPTGLSPAELKAEGRYVEDVY